MPLLRLEHSPTAYRVDFALYAAASAALGLLLVLGCPAGSARVLAVWSVAGAALWTLVEYLLHRFVLHGLPPFKRWHAEHHQRPTALIASPPLMSGVLFVLLATLPGWWLLGGWPACALTFGLITGYLIYGLTHHATHHAVPLLHGRSAWLAQRRRWHALHHAAARAGAEPGHYGVSSSLWDHAFGTQRAVAAPRRVP